MIIQFPTEFNIKNNIPLSTYTKIKIGGKAKYLVEIDNQNEFVKLYQFCRQQSIRFLSLGHGSNVFFSDQGFNGLIAIIKFNHISSPTETTISAEAGVSLSDVNNLCVDKNLTGFEFSSGIPGTVGGAIYGNAGAYGKAVGDCLSKAKILTADGKTKWVCADYFNFSYRYSELKTNNAIVLETEFQLIKGDPIAIRERVDEILELRKKKLPPEDLPTAGSFFKNIKDDQGNPTPAAKLLDAIGSKTTKVGSAGVYHGHANIFYNRGHATANDILMLEEILKERVFKKFGIQLEREVMYFE